MAVNANNSNEQVVKERIPSTGPVKVSVVAINPNMAEMVAMGMNVTEEPQYITVGDDGTKKCRLDIYVTGNEGKFKTKLAFFLENKERANNSGDKFEIINNYCQSTWATSINEAVQRVGRNGNTWFDEKGARVALGGEVDFYNFIQNWANAKLDEECFLDNLKAIFDGNFSELKGLVKVLANNELYVMATVSNRNGKFYQGVNNKYFGRATSKKFAMDFMGYADKQSKANYPLKEQWSLEFKEFDATTIVADPEPANTDVDDVVF